MILPLPFLRPLAALVLPLALVLAGAAEARPDARKSSAPTAPAPAGTSAGTTHLGPWLTHAQPTPEGGMLLGNPQAPLKLVEYMSYTCPHCAHFEAEGVPRLRLTVVADGKVSLEVRNFLRGPVDMAVALLTHCAPPPRFFALHSAFLHRQEEWVLRQQGLSQAQFSRWESGEDAARMRAIASDLKLYDIAESHGIGRVAADRCLSDKAEMQRLAEQSAQGARLGITGTPMFLLNGTLLNGTYDWSMLEPQISARL